MSKVSLKKYKDKDKKLLTMIITVSDSKDKWKGDFCLKNDEPLLLYKLLKKEFKLK